MITRIVRAIHVSILIALTTMAPVAHALKIQVGRQMMIRTMEGAQLNHAGYVQAGTVVEIPDKYAVVDTSGRVNMELTLNHWLKEAGYEQNDIDGRGNGERNDFFFPVKVNGATRYMSLRVLAREQGSLVVQEFADIYEGSPDDLPLMSMERPQEQRPSSGGSPTQIVNRYDELPDSEASVPPPPPPPPEIRPMAAPLPPARIEAVGPCTDCTPSPGSAGAIQTLREMVQPALNRAAREYESSRARTTQTAAITSTFRASCGINLKDFLPVIQRVAAQYKVPPTIMLTLMSQESMGDCYLRPGTGSGSNKGLFQINVGSKRANIPVCTAAQKSQLLRAGNVSGMINGPRCLENPVVNAEEAARILRSKLDYVMDRLPKQSFVRADGKNFGYTANAWRLAAAGYNGGEAYVVNAYNSMRAFNAKHGTNYQPTNWNDFKVFMFRNYLDAGKQRQQYGTVLQDRAWTRTALNVGYAENILPVAAGTPGRQTNVEAWAAYIRENGVR